MSKYLLFAILKYVETIISLIYVLPMSLAMLNNRTHTQIHQTLTDRQTDRQTDTHTHKRQTHTHTHTQETDRQTQINVKLLY